MDAKMQTLPDSALKEMPRLLKDNRVLHFLGTTFSFPRSMVPLGFD